MPSPIPQISFGGGTLSPQTYSRIDLQKFGSGAKRLENYFVRAEGGASNRSGFAFVKETKDSTKVSRVIPFEFNEAQAYALEFGDLYMRVLSNGGVVLEAADTITAITAADPPVVSVVNTLNNGDEVWIDGVVGMTELNGMFYTVANATGTTIELSGVLAAGFTAYISDGTVARVFTLVTPYASADLAELKFRQSNDVVYLTHHLHAPRKLSRLGAANWTLTTITFTPTQAAPTGVTVTPQGTAGSTTWSYYVTAIAEETFEESIVAAGSTSTGNAVLSSTNFNRITFTAATDAESYNVYKEDNGLYGYIGTTETLTFDDKNILADLNDTAPKLRRPFLTSSNYPEAVGLHEQRSWWGNSINDPLTVWSSQTGQFENTNVSSPTKATDAITMRLVTGKGNEIRHFRSFRESLFIFTSGAVWTLGPGGDADAITPASKQLKVQEFLGSTQVPPLTIKTALLMVAGKADQGFEVHAVGEDVNSGVAGNYVGSDLTVLSRHLFEGHSIVEWAYLERPHRIILAIRDDGKILCMTYLNEHQIFAWTIWETDGLYESICHVPEGQEDTAYVVVNRTINGGTKRYVEQLQSRIFANPEDAFFVDCGLTYVGAATTTISGLDHLEAETVIALADGNLETGLVVTNGTITLANASSKVTVGMPYTSLIETLPINAAPETLSKRKIVKAVVMRVQEARGIFAGTVETNLDEYPTRSDELWGTPSNPVSDLIRINVAGDWKRDTGVFITSSPGLPQTILSIIADTEVGGG
jgi:hypothetical protein